jgi:hypothetical protein
MRGMTCLQIPTRFWIGPRITSLLLNVLGVSYVRQMEKHTAELLALQLSNFEVDASAEKLKRYTSLSTDQIHAEVFQVCVCWVGWVKHYILRCIISWILFGIRKSSVSSGKNLLAYPFTGMMIKLNVVVSKVYQLHTIFYPVFFSLR